MDKKRREIPEYHAKPCILCGSPKEYGYRNTSNCGACTAKKRKAKRVYTGKLPNGAGRKSTCAKCGNKKDEKYMNGGWCGPCKNSASKEKTAANRLAQGLPAWGSKPASRKLTCCRCGSEKENKKAGYCRACAREQDNEWRLKTGRTLKHRTGMCQCGKPFAPYSKCYCLECSHKKAKEYRDRNPERMAEIWKRVNEKQQEKDDWPIKNFARQTVRAALRAGVIEKLPCSVCGTQEKVEAHHEDYLKPIDVIWLCSFHHKEHHRLNKTEI